MSSTVIECSKFASISDNGNSDFVVQMKEPITVNTGDVISLRNCFINTNLESLDNIELANDTVISMRFGYYELNYDNTDKSNDTTEIDFDYHIPYVVGNSTQATLASVSFRCLYNGEDTYLYADVSFVDASGKNYSYTYRPPWMGSGIRVRVPLPTTGQHSTVVVTYNINNVIMRSMKVSADDATGEFDQKVIGPTWGVNTHGNTHLFEGYFSTVVESGEYNRANLAKTITDKLQYAIPANGQSKFTANNDFLRRTDDLEDHFGLVDKVNIQAGQTNYVELTSNFADINALRLATCLDNNLDVVIKGYYNVPPNTVPEYTEFPAHIDTQANNGVEFLAGGVVRLNFNNVPALFATGASLINAVVAVPYTERRTPLNNKNNIGVGERNYVTLSVGYATVDAVRNATGLDYGMDVKVYGQYGVTGGPYKITTFDATIATSPTGFTISGGGVVTVVFDTNVFQDGYDLQNALVYPANDLQLTFQRVEKAFGDGLAYPYFYNAPYYIGASEAVLEYNEDRSVFDWSFLHMPIYNTPPAGGTPQMGITTYLGTDNAPETDNKYYTMTQRSGIFFLKDGLNPPEFWTSLGFDVDALTVGLDANKLVNRAELDAKIPKGYSALASLVPNGEAKVQPPAGNKLEELTTDTLPVFGSSLSADDLGGFYLVEMIFGDTLEYVFSGGINSHIHGIVSKYQQVKDYISTGSEASIIYEHTSPASFTINSIRCRILDPVSKQPVSDLGEHSSIFIEVQRGAKDLKN